MDAPTDMESADAPQEEPGLWTYYGPRIKAAREKRGLSVGALAETVGIGHKTLNNIERAEHGTSLPNLMKIAEALDYPLTHFLPIKKGPIYDQLWMSLLYLSERQAAVVLALVEELYTRSCQEPSPC